MASEIFKNSLNDVPEGTKQTVRLHAQVIERVNFLLEAKRLTWEDVPVLLDDEEPNLFDIRQLAVLEDKLGAPIISVTSNPVNFDTLWGGRREGRTTRIVDLTIQALFRGETCKMLDPRESGSRLFDLVLNRLKNEHEWVFRHGVIDIDYQKLEISLSDQTSPLRFSQNHT